MDGPDRADGPPPRRPTTGRRRTARRRWIGTTALSVAVVALVGALVARAAVDHPPTPASTRSSSATTATAAPATRPTALSTTTTIDPGSLPQTETFPAASGPAFAARMAALWSGVMTGSVQPALPAFFPESAYVTLKAESDPAADYTDRLLAEYADDLAAAHGLLGADPSAAVLVGVDVDESYGHWVPPGSCFNGVGYFEVPNARVVYAVDGQTRSFGVASMISWRGQWYVVHLGAVLRSGSGGQVDGPQSGPGTPLPSSTC